MTFISMNLQCSKISPHKQHVNHFHMVSYHNTLWVDSVPKVSSIKLPFRWEWKFQYTADQKKILSKMYDETMSLGLIGGLSEKYISELFFPGTHFLPFLVFCDYNVTYVAYKRPTVSCPCQSEWSESSPLSNRTTTRALSSRRKVEVIHRLRDIKSVYNTSCMSQSQMVLAVHADTVFISCWYCSLLRMINPSVMLTLTEEENCSRSYGIVTPVPLLMMKITQGQAFIHLYFKCIFLKLIY